MSVSEHLPSNSGSSIPAEFRRYHRQMLLPDIGLEGQRRLGASTAVVVGCGALGTVAADLLVRAGVGTVRIIDRDVVEWTNLQRQTLFEEQDARDGVPKAVAAAAWLGRVNSHVRVEPVVADIRADNIEEHVFGVPRDERSAGGLVIVDGTDNYETRFLINDVSVKHGVPWVYGGAVGTRGMQATFVPAPERPCLRCVFPDAPERGTSETCDTVGVLGPIPGIIASCQVVEAIKLLLGRMDLVSGTLLEMDPWQGMRRRLELGANAKNSECVCCVQRQFEALDAVMRGSADDAVSLCGRDAVQILSGVSGGGDARKNVDLDAIAERLSRVGASTRTPWLVRAKVDETHEITVFADGRAMIAGTTDFAKARSLYARYIGA